jgi:hypothetical protein
MPTSPNKTKVVGVRLTHEEVTMIERAASEDGAEGVSPFVRKLILSSLNLPTPPTLLLESVLALQFGMYEMAKKAAEGTPLSAAKIQSLQDKLEISGTTLVTRFMNRRGQKEKG